MNEQLLIEKIIRKLGIRANSSEEVFAVIGIYVLFVVVLIFLAWCVWI